MCTLVGLESVISDPRAPELSDVLMLEIVFARFSRQLQLHDD